MFVYSMLFFFADTLMATKLSVPVTFGRMILPVFIIFMHQDKTQEILMYLLTLARIVIEGIFAYTVR
jgi:hypothetical protein